MESVELLERRARRRYELARLRRAVLGFAPIFVLVALAALFAERPSTTAAFGAAVFAVGAVFLYYGRDLRRAVLPGVAAGLVPLVLTLALNHVEHACLGDRCMTLCIPACAAGGLVAGLVVSTLAVRRSSGIGFWLAASGVALLTGSMACGCVGYAGIAGLALGFAAGLASGVAGDVFRKRST